MNVGGNERGKNILVIQIRNNIKKTARASPLAGLQRPSYWLNAPWLPLTLPSLMPPSPLSLTPFLSFPYCLPHTPLTFLHYLTPSLIMPSPSLPSPLPRSLMPTSFSPYFPLFPYLTSFRLSSYLPLHSPLLPLLFFYCLHYFHP